MSRFSLVCHVVSLLFLSMAGAAPAATVHIAVTDANGQLVNNAQVSLGGYKPIPSPEGLWTADLPLGKSEFSVEHPAVGASALGVDVDSDQIYVIVRIVGDRVAVRRVTANHWPGTSIAGLRTSGQPVSLPPSGGRAGWGASQTSLPPSGSAQGAGCGAVTVTQNLDPETIEELASVSCNAGGVNLDNWYARSFDMSVEYPSVPTFLKCIDVGVETNTLDYTITVNVYHDPSGGDPDDGPSATCGTNDWILLDSSPVFIPDGTSLDFVTVDYGEGILLPLGATIVVEVFTPDRQVTDNGSFFLGANSYGQTAPSWIATDTCGLDCYLTTDGIGFPNAQWVMRLDIDPAGSVIGACCDDATGVCLDDVVWYACAERFVATTQCSDLIPPCGAVGACCHPDGSCTDGSFEGDCVSGGGSYQGNGTDCAGANCPQPPDGACCAGDGSCTIANEFTCASNWQGAGTVCDPNPCPPYFVCVNGVDGQLGNLEGEGGAGTIAAVSDVNPDAGTRVAENFTPVSAGTITSVCWWGIYFDFYDMQGCGPGSGDAFTITYHNDDAGGAVPGSVHAGPFTTDARGVATGRWILISSGPVAEYGYEATHPPVSVGADTCYWISIVNETTGTCFWLWTTAPPGDQRAAQTDTGGVDFHPTDYDMSLSLDLAFDTAACWFDDPCEGTTGDCCMANGTPGCYEASCCASVCAQDAYCCDVVWDDICAELACHDPWCGCDCAEPPPNDECWGARPANVPSVTPGSTWGATIDSEFPTCGTSITAPGVWFKVIGTGETMTATTCENESPPGSADYDTKISVFCTGCDAPTCVTGNDDVTGCNFHSKVQWCSQLGAEYLILVHGFSSATGNFELSVFDDGVACTSAVFCGSLLPTGACCQPGGVCDEQSEPDCEVLGGVYQGDDTECNVQTGNPIVLLSSPGLPIPDDDAVGVSDTINVGDSLTIGDVDIDLVITHTWIGDLCAIVEHGGTTVTLVQRIGDNAGLVCDAIGCCGLNADNMDIILDDEAAGGPINDASAPVTGDYGPEQALSAFDGMDTAGAWTITVIDNVDGDSGSIDQWSLHLAEGRTICPVCGNGILEEGEACDGDACCDADCTIVIAGEVCRGAAGECDLAEACDGQSAACPVDVKSTDVCRPPTGMCDPPEVCSGTGDACPEDVVITECRVDVSDQCCPPGCHANNDADCAPACGNGVVEAGEECDDGNADETDACTYECRVRQPVPAVSSWGALILALLLLAAAKVWLPRISKTGRTRG